MDVLNTNRREFLKNGAIVLATGSILPILQSCSKNGLSPFKEYAICQESCTGCGDCFDVCEDEAVILPEKSYFRIDTTECTSCGKCVSDCSHEAIHVTHKSYVLNSEACVGCGKCVEVCNTEGQAISWERDSYQIRGKCKANQCNQECVSICEEDAITIVNNKAIIDTEKCTRCGKCVSACPIGAVNPAHVKMDESLCTFCGKCAQVCEFEGAVTVVKPEGYLDPYIDPELCQLCGDCKTACEDHNAIKWASNKASIDLDKCSGCGKCEPVCSYDAVRSVG